MKTDVLCQNSPMIWRSPELSVQFRAPQPVDCRNKHGVLPKDPRCWDREDVHLWLNNISRLHNLGSIPADRFLMNGKALCLMSMEMFVQRVPLGGKLLYKDFQLRLGAAMYS